MVCFEQKIDRTTMREFSFDIDFKTNELVMEFYETFEGHFCLKVSKEQARLLATYLSDWVNK